MHKYLLAVLIGLVLPTQACIAESSAAEPYRKVQTPQPVSVPPGHVEVVEFFWYGCTHCDALEESLHEWLRKKPDYIEFRRVHAISRPEMREHAKLYGALAELDESKLDGAVFDAFHRKQQRLYKPDDEEATAVLQTDFARAHGIAAEKFLAVRKSPVVQRRLDAARALMVAYKIEGVPAFVVNGKYVTSVGLAGSREQMWATIDRLAAMERDASTRGQ